MIHAIEMVWLINWLTKGKYKQRSRHRLLSSSVLGTNITECFKAVRLWSSLLRTLTSCLCDQFICRVVFPRIVVLVDRLSSEVFCYSVASTVLGWSLRFRVSTGPGSLSCALTRGPLTRLWNTALSIAKLIIVRVSCVQWLLTAMVS